MISPLCCFYLFALVTLQGVSALSVAATSRPAPAPARTSQAGAGSIDDAASAALLLQEHLDGRGATRFCEIGKTQYGRGLVATRDLSPGDTALTIPISEVMVVDVAGMTQDVSGEEWRSSSYSSSSSSDTWAVSLARQMMERQLDLSWPCPYLDALPSPPPSPARGDWPLQALRELDDPGLLKEIQAAVVWRKEQWEHEENRLLGCDNHLSNDTVYKATFLDALDLVSSRTIRCDGSKFMLVPLLDMANYASRDQGGGYYELVRGGKEIVLKVGDRGVGIGEEICLDYGDRRNEDWLIYYGFLPDRRNLAESIVLPRSQRKITWKNVGSGRIVEDDDVKEECRAMLGQANTTLGEDIDILNRLEERSGSAGCTNRHENSCLCLALKHRIARKTLLSAVAGVSTSSALTSAFLHFEAD